MAVDHIRYDLLVREALREVVRRVLADVARNGLPGDHHFYVSFHTGAPGVRISPRLKARYPDEMTIVLQHQFWDLVVTDTTLEVGLSFAGIPERLFVPFDAIKGFFDPSVQFGLEFEVAAEPAEGAEMDDAPTALPPPAPATKTRRGPRAVRAKEGEAEKGRPAAAKPATSVVTAEPEPKPPKPA